MTAQPRRAVRFGPYKFHPGTGELCKGKVPIRLRTQTAAVLTMLIERQGELVTREELCRRVWGEGSFVDPEYSLDFCIRQIQAALSDESGLPQYIETLPSGGFRFLQPITKVIDFERNGSNRRIAASEIANSQHLANESLNESRQARSSLLMLVAVALGAILVTAALVACYRYYAGGDPARITSLILLPLDNMTGDPRQEYLADGLTESLTTDLGRIHGLRVIGHRSALRLKAAPISTHEIGRELKVQAVLQGSLVKDGDHVRIAGRLTDARTGASLWSEAYDREMETIPGLEDEIARAVAEHVQLKSGTAEGIGAGPQAYRTTPTAYARYLQAKFEWNKRSAAGLHASIEEFKQATEADPSFAEPYAGLAEAYIVLTSLGLMPSAEAYPAAEQAAAEALRLNPELAAAHASRANVLKVYYRDWAAAEKEYSEALRLNPNDALTRQWYADYLAIVNRLGDAIGEARHARDLDPLAPAVNSFLGFILLRTGRPGEAEGELRSVAQTSPLFAPGHWFLGWTLEMQGQYTAALEELERAASLAPDNPLFSGALGRAYALTGDRTRAIQILSSMENVKDANSARPYGIAKIYAGLNDRDRMFEWLTRADAARSAQIIHVQQDPDFLAFHSDSRFDSLLSRMHLPKM